MAREVEPAAPELRDYLRTLQRRKWTIAIVVVAVVGAAVVASLLQSRVYEARTALLLRAPSGTTQSSGSAQVSPQIVGTQLELIKSDPVKNIVRKKIGAAPDVAAKAVGSTLVIEILADSTNPTRAATIANAYADAFIEFRRTQALSELQATGNALQPQISDLQ